MEVPFTYEHIRPLTMAPQFMISPQPGSFWSSLMLEQLADSSVWHAGLQWRDMGVFWCLRDPRLASSFDSPSFTCLCFLVDFVALLWWYAFRLLCGFERGVDSWL